jgi:hypothetical protein
MAVDYSLLERLNMCQCGCGLPLTAVHSQFEIANRLRGLSRPAQIDFFEWIFSELGLDPEELSFRIPEPNLANEGDKVDNTDS